jgi:hypothetical protein
LALIIIDDALLYAVLADHRQPTTDPYIDAATRSEVFTTGSWYWRLSRALAHRGRGSLSRAFLALDESERRRVSTAVSSLPDTIGLLGLRNLVPVMAALPGQLNFLTAEAVATALVLDATIAVTTESDLLRQAAAAAGVSLEVVNLRR